MIELYTRVGSQNLRRDDPFFKFPAGEWHMKDDGNTFIGHEIAYISGTNVNDYVKGMLWSDSIASAKSHTAIIPYLPAARGDKGTPRAANIYASILPDAEKIIFVDAHSSYMPSVISSTRMNPEMINVTAATILENYFDDNKFDGIIAPDEGALTRAQEVATVLDVPLYKAKKHRDQATGQLSGFSCEEVPELDRLLVVDDICDGGGTFNGLINAMRQAGYKGNASLYVTHGIFSKGLWDLNNNFHKIYTTDTIYEPVNMSTRLPEIIPIKDYLLSLA